MSNCQPCKIVKLSECQNVKLSKCKNFKISNAWAPARYVSSSLTTIHPPNGQWLNALSIILHDADWFSWYCSSCFDSCCDSFPRTYNYWGCVRLREFPYTLCVRSREFRYTLHCVCGQENFRTHCIRLSTSLFKTLCCGKFMNVLDWVRGRLGLRVPTWEPI